jgi:GTP cyclohydrolase II
MYPFENWLHEANSHRLATGRPLVGLCYAQSLDGSLTARRGQPMALSGAESTGLTHRLRTLHDGILAGVGTVLADDPQLTVRFASGRQPQPVILDSRLRTPLQSGLMSPDRQAPKPWIAATPQAEQRRKDELEAAGARVLVLPEAPKGRVSLLALLSRLGELGLDSLMVEGGARVITSFLTQGLVDFSVITISPSFVGGMNLITPGGLTSRVLRSGFPRLNEMGYDRLGDDLIIWGRLN